VITRRRARNLPLYLQDPDNRESLTSIKYISVYRRVIPPLIILSGKVMSEKDFPQTLPGNYMMAITDTGYANNEISIEWLRHFNCCTKFFSAGRYRMLISDGYKSYLEYEFIDYC
jgi:hypothetical protein